MNEVIQALLERRSIRKFTDQPVDRETLATILNAGIHAPSARNTQPWAIVALTKPADIAQLNQALKKAVTRPGFDQYAALVTPDAYSINFKTAPVFVIVSVDPAETLCPAEDGALALGNILLAAHSLGLGGCWVNQFRYAADEPETRLVLTGFGIPEGNKIIGCAVLGYPAVANPKAPARKTGLVKIVG